MDRRDRLQERVEVLAHQTEMLTQHTRTVERRRRQIACGVVILLGAIVITLGSVTPAHAHDIQCRDVLGPGGRFELEHDLACGDRALAVRDGAILDLNGHLVTCHGAFQCIILFGTGAQLLNGAVQANGLESIVLAGTGGHTVRNVTSTVADHNIVVRSDYNQLSNVMAESTNNPAFDIIGHYNRLADSIARCVNQGVGFGCIEVSGHENRLIQNFATATGSPDFPDSGQNGFAISGHDNVLRGNRAIGNEGRGIVVSGTGNRLTRNTALENGLDLQDTNGDCAHNTWGQNTFRTSDPACIGQGSRESVADMER